jgi:hypothetical protein
MEPELEAVKDKMRSTGKPLGEQFDLAFGLKTGDDSRFLTYSPSTDEDKRLLRGEDVHRYSYQFKGEYVHYVPKERWFIVVLTVIFIRLSSYLTYHNETEFSLDSW